MSWLNMIMREGARGEGQGARENAETGYAFAFARPLPLAPCPLPPVYCRSMPAPQRILIVQPSWVGDAVMATPTLRAIRNLYPTAHISFLLRRYVKPIYSGMPWADKLITYRTGRTKAKAGKGQFFDLAARLRRGRFDLAVLL